MVMATNANEIPIAEPVIIAVVDVSSLPPINNTEDKDGFSCGVPPNASRPVQATRKISLMIIVIHIIALFFGQIFWVQWLAALIAIGMGSTVICNIKKRVYMTAAVLYAVGTILDIVSVLFWVMNADALAEEMDNDDMEKGETERTIKLFSLTPAVGAFCQFFGAIAATTAIYTWQNSGAPDAAPVVELSSPVRFSNNIYPTT